MPKRKPVAPAPKAKAKAGRPTKFDESILGTVTRLARLGATDPEMAEALEVGTATITRWMKSHKAFRLAYKEGKVEADMKVADSLFNRTQFHEYKKMIAFKVKTVLYSENGKRLRETEEIVEKEVTEVLPPDTTAIIYWLNNRRKVEWRTRREIVLSDDELDRMTPDQLRDLAAGKVPAGVR